MRKLVRKSYTPVVPIANTCSIGYPHDGRADNAAYRHNRRADNAAYRHDRRADSHSPLFICLILEHLNLNSLLVTHQMTLFHQGVRMGEKLVS